MSQGAIVNPNRAIPRFRLNNVTPFTYRDGLTYLQVLETLRGEFSDLTDEHNEVVSVVNDFFDQMVDSFGEHIVESEAHYNDFVDLINQEWANYKANLQDTVLQGLDVIAGLTGEDEAVAYLASDRTTATGGAIRDAIGAINVLDFGAMGDGTTDDTAAVQAALNDAADGGTVLLPPGRYLVGALTVPSGAVLAGMGSSSVLVQSGAPSNLIVASGTTGPAVALTVDAAVGATDLSVASTAGWSAGDLLILTDTVSYAETDASYKSGEMLRVAAVTSSGSVSLVWPVKGSFGHAEGTYTVENAAAVKRVNPVQNVGLRNLTIEGNPATTTNLFRARYAEGVALSGVTVTKGGSAAVILESVHNATVSGGSISNLTSNIGAGHVGYGVAVNQACEGVTIIGVNFTNVRHAVTTMGGPDGIPRRIVVNANTVVSGPDTALDTHAAADLVIISNNNCVGAGISVRGRRVNVLGNMVVRPASHGINVTETVARDVLIEGNTVRGQGPGALGITSGVAVAGLTIRGNKLDGVRMDGIRVDASATRVEIVGNSVRDFGLGRTGILASAPTGTPGTQWVVADNLVGRDSAGAASRAIEVTALTSSYVLDNRAFGTFNWTTFDTGTNTARRNELIDQAAPAVTGSRGGNAALDSLLTVLAANGYITNSTTA